MQTHIRVDGVPEVKRQLAKLAAEAPSMVGRAVRAGGARLGEGMERRAPKLSDQLEGTVGESIQTRRVSDTEILVGTDHGLARTFEDGGEVTPSRRRVLASREQDVVFGRRVVIPARPFVRPAVDEDRRDVAAAVQRSAVKSLNKVVHPR